MPALSVVMIVKNEAHCIGQCLEGIRDCADEIVIGDTGSTDDTVSIAQGHGARVFPLTWNDDFSEARNRVIGAARGDWLLHLDADEVVDPEGSRRLRGVVDADGAGADAIEVTLANYCDDVRAWRWVPVVPGDAMARGFSGYIAARLLRLFRNGRGFEYREPVHENITESVLENGGVIRPEPILIHHYGYRPGNAPDPAKARFYLALGRKKTALRPQDPKAWHDLAEQTLACGDADEAEAACRKALAIDPLHLGAATTMANILLNRGDLLEAEALFRRLETAGVTPPHVVLTLGAIACRLGRLDEARARLDAVLDAVPGNVMARYYLARTLDRMNDAAGARAQLEAAVAHAPSLSEFRDYVQAHALRCEGKTCFAAGDLARALRALVASLRLEPEDPITHNDLGVVLHAIGDDARARACFERALKLAPGMPQAIENLRGLPEKE